MNFTHLLILPLFVLALCICSVTSAFSQEEVNDPLKKPAIWEKLVKEPSNRGLWAKYFGKPLEKLSYEENEKLSLWSQVLTLRSIMAEEVVIESSDDEEAPVESDVAYGADGKEVIVMDQTDFDNLTQMVMSEQEEVAELKANIYENFVILEDLFRDIFKEHDQKYVSYDEAHPNGEFPIVRWVEETEKKIQEMKNARLKEISSRIKIRGSSN
jgi:hypothetical protein